MYNQKSKSIINKIKRTYEFDNKGLIPIAIIVVIGGILLSEVIIGLYGAFLIVCLYAFNTKLLSKFDKINVNSDNLTYIKDYRNVIKSVTNATKKIFVFAIPLAVLSIFIVAFYVRETSFLSRFILKETSFLQFVGIGLIITLIVTVIGWFAFAISTKILYGTLVSKLDDIINELEVLKK